MLSENTNYGDMNQGIDRITEILKRQSAPVASSPYMPEASGLPSNILNAIASSSYNYGNGGSNFVQNAQKYQDTAQDNALGQQQAILKTYEMKLKMGDAQAKALDDKLTLFTGNDPEGKALFLQALHDDPDPIDPSNSYQVMTKLASIKKQTGYESPDLALEKKAKEADIASKLAFANQKNTGDSKTNFKNANTLRDEFNSLTKDFRTVQDAYSKINKTSGTGAGDMSMLYQYVKLLDPGSVVRESEFATAAASGSFGERIQGAAKSVIEGGRLPPSLRQEFLTESKNIYEGQKSGYDRQKQIYTGLSNNFNVDPDLVVTDYTELNPAPPTGGGEVKFLGFEE